MISNLTSWNKYVEKNKDPYGKACVDVAREVMRVLDDGKDFNAHNLLCHASESIGEDGLTGFMAGCVAEMVKRCHSRGEEFNDKWNESYGVSKEKAKGGTVNPAILTMGEK